LSSNKARTFTRSFTEETIPSSIGFHIILNARIVFKGESELPEHSTDAEPERYPHINPKREATKPPSTLYPRKEGGEKAGAGRHLFKASGQCFSMKGTIESLRFKTDSKKQPYAVATIAGEDVYTWDKGLIDSLKAAGEGSEISYELAERSNDFKFNKFKELALVGEAGPLPSGWQADHIRIPALTEIKSRTEVMRIAASQAEAMNLKPDKIPDKTEEIAARYMRFIERGYEGLFDSIRPLKDED
jgi:hypothetical protein